MCTVTFIPTNSSFYLTSSGDEHSKRGTAIVPNKFAAKDGGEIVYPQDTGAGGNWITVKNIGSAAV